MAFKQSKSNVVAGLFAATGAGFAPMAAWAADAESINGRVEAFGGIARDERPLDGSRNAFSGGLLPSVGFRLAPKTLLQIDGMAARHAGETMFATAAHLGVRASDDLTVGLYSSYAHFKPFGGLDAFRLGAEAAYHAGKISVSGVAGYEHTERTTVAVGQTGGFNVVDTYGKGGAFFSMADVSMYLDDNWSVSVGHRYVGGRHAAVLGTEKALAASAGGRLSVFAEARVGSHDNKAAWVGVRFRFGGGGSSLITRDRGDGYANRLKDELFGIGNTRRRGQTPGGTVITPPLPPVPPTPVDPCPGGSCYAT